MPNPNQAFLPIVEPSTLGEAQGINNPNVSDGLVRGTAGVVGYQALGINLLAMPGVAPKVLGAGFIAAGVREQYVGVAGNEASTRPLIVNLRERVNNFARNLRDNNADKSSLSARLKSQVSGELLDSKDRQFRTIFSRYMGGSVMIMSGVQFMSQTTTSEQIAGSVIASVGLVEQIYNSSKLVDRHAELADERAKTKSNSN